MALLRRRPTSLEPLTRLRICCWTKHVWLGSAAGRLIRMFRVGVLMRCLRSYPESTSNSSRVVAQMTLCIADRLISSKAPPQFRKSLLEEYSLKKIRSWKRGLGGSTAALLACVALMGCISSPPDPGPEMSAGQIANHYKLGAGDRVRLTVYNQPNLSNDYSVDGSGSVAIPLIGPVKAGEQTARDLEQAITK